MSFEYALLLGLILLTVWLNYHSGTSVITKNMFVLIVVLMVAMAGLRNESVGRDYGVYREYFELGPLIGKGSFISDWIKSLVNVDIGWVFLGSFIKTIGLPFEMMVFLVATLAVGLSAKFYFSLK